MKLFLKDKFLIFSQEKEFRLTIQVAACLWGLSLIFLLLKWRGLPPQVPIFYSLPWGEEQLGNPIFLFLLPLSSLFFGILNYLLAIWSFRDYPLASKILIWLSVLITLLTTIALVKIILLIT